MKTDRLIDMLSANLEPVNRGLIGRAFAVSLFAGAIAAFALMAVTVGPRSDLSAATLGPVLVKLAIALALVGASVAYLIGLARPGRQTRKWRAPILALMAIMAALAIALALRHATMPAAQISKAEWAVCLVCVPLFSTIPFAALIWALRQAAPTRLSLTGALAGLAAGGLGAAAYALHCPIDSLPFVLLWYGVAAAFCALIGALLGPRLLRW